MFYSRKKCVCPLFSMIVLIVTELVLLCLQMIQSRVRKCVMVDCLWIVCFFTL